MQDKNAMVITFWRPSRWDRGIYDKESRGPAEQGRFLEEVYTWKLAESVSVWNGIVEPDITERLTKLLMDDFSPDRKPEERKIEILCSALEQIREIVKNGKSEWSDCEQDEYVEEIDLRANLLLSFLHHLTWLCDILVNVPGISVTIR